MAETKVCSRCGKEKTLDNFTFKKDKGTYRSECHECRREEYRTNPALRDKVRERARKYYRDNERKVRERRSEKYASNLSLVMWGSAKRRAKEKGVPFDIEVGDIVVPEVCPVLGIPLIKGSGRPEANSPSLDRIIPEKGYVRDNIEVISHKANTIKSNATVEELEKVAAYYKKRSVARLDMQKEEK